MKTVLLTLGLVISLLLNTSATVAAENISEQEAVKIATRSYPGRVLSVKRSKDTYRIKTLSDNGKVRVVVVDAASGKIVPGK